MTHAHLPSSIGIDKVCVSRRCSTILVRNRDRELFCVSCDMFLRPEQQAPTPALPSPAQLDQPQQRVLESDIHSSPAKADAQVAHLQDSSASRTPGCSRVLALMMDTMELLAEQLREDVSSRDCQQSTLQETVSGIESLASTYHCVRTKCE